MGFTGKGGAAFSSKFLEWGTPPEIFDPLDEEFGFTLDVCAIAGNAKCRDYFTPKEDGLSRAWCGNVCWMNPPYGRAIAKWIQKAYEEARLFRDGVTVVCLVPARTDTAWWHDYCMKGEIRFLRGRVKFLQSNGEPGLSAPFPSAVVIFRSTKK